jgi:hypothetical protein
MGTSSGFPIAYARCSWARLCAIKTADKIKVATTERKLRLFASAPPCYPRRSRFAVAAEQWAVGLLGWCSRQSSTMPGDAGVLGIRTIVLTATLCRVAVQGLVLGWLFWEGEPLFFASELGVSSLLTQRVRFTSSTRI